MADPVVMNPAVGVGDPGSIGSGQRSATLAARALAPSARWHGIRLALVGILVVGAALAARALGPDDAASLIRLGIVTLAAAGGVVALSGLVQAAVGRRFDVLTLVCSTWLGLLCLSVLLADVLPLPEARDASKTISDPSLTLPDLVSRHPLGTDRQALDLLGAIVYGARISLVVGLGAVLIGLLLGGGLGLLAGFLRGRIDAVVTFFADATISFPPVILLLSLVTILDPSVASITFGLGIVSVPTYLRLSRAATMSYASREFVVAARALGSPRRRIMWREIVPCILPTLVSYSFIVVAVLVVAEASLSFLGLSIQRPNPTWGNLIAAGQRDFDRHPHLVFGPGVALFATVFALNCVGEAARRRARGRS